MRHPRCQSANSNCGGLNLRLPRCMLWPSETLSPLFSLPVSASGRCVSVRLSHVAPQRYSPWAGRVRSVQHGSQVGVPSGFSAVRRFRVSTVRSSRSRRALSSVIAGDLRSQIERAETVGVRVRCIFYLDGLSSQSAESDMVRERLSYRILSARSV